MTHTKTTLNELLANYDAFLFDCDGVLYLDQHVLDLVPEFISILQEFNKNVIFVTNNSTKTRDDYVKMFHSMNIHVKREQIQTAGFVTVQRLSKLINPLSKDCDPVDKRVAVIGELGFVREFEEAGFEVYSQPKTVKEAKEMSDIGISTVVCGHSPSFIYAHGCLATLVKNSPHFKRFYASNLDPAIPSIHGILPGAGAINDYLTAAMGMEPILGGKPSKIMFDTIIGSENIDIKRTIMFGDRLNTDILFALNIGCDSCLMLSGVTDEDDMKNSEIKATVYAESITALMKEYYQVVACF
eukprot:TRINITY_DN2078_c0_g1_i1.p1 TRINITY_DN2078_c0_g1~~TRINITY_DN2078_c0_g1_i1.p1  ORF type:complete len:311 (+),score=85.16 TRINITY_DN2078_c0_g1_i1:38-934(+)